MIVDISIDDERWQQADLAALAEGAAQTALIHLGLAPEDFEVSLLGCDDARIEVLNGEFREQGKPTNVLSWPAVDLAADGDGAVPLPPEPDQMTFEGDDKIELGDIAIAYETCAREAIEQGKTLPDHTVHLIVHGVLHLLGYDHIRDKDATLMEDNERVILGKLGIDDPYMNDNTGI
ncbi:MAG: rRNA maturation RNase YbeY [Rhodobacterales bacterium]|nr:rRNA maturation RNase YbeY [Rhodobacterales bacterium]